MMHRAANLVSFSSLGCIFIPLAFIQWPNGIRTAPGSLGNLPPYGVFFVDFLPVFCRQEKKKMTEGILA